MTSSKITIAIEAWYAKEKSCSDDIWSWTEKKMLKNIKKSLEKMLCQMTSKWCNLM